jgi:hypothetical protein
VPSIKVCIISASKKIKELLEHHVRPGPSTSLAEHWFLQERDRNVKAAIVGAQSIVAAYLLTNTSPTFLHNRARACLPLLASNPSSKLPAASRDLSVELNGREYRTSPSYPRFMGWRVWLVLAAVFAAAATPVVKGEQVADCYSSSQIPMRLHLQQIKLASSQIHRNQQQLQLPAVLFLPVTLLVTLLLLLPQAKTPSATHASKKMARGFAAELAPSVCPSERSLTVADP